MLAASAFSSFMEYSGELSPVYDRRVQQPRASLDVESCVCMTDDRFDVEVIHTSTGISAVSRKSMASDEADVAPSKPRKCRGSRAKSGALFPGSAEQSSESGSFRQIVGRWMAKRRAASVADNGDLLLSSPPKHSDIFL